MKLGLDTFELNGILDWTQVATRYSFGWIKATESISSDMLFLDNWSKASALCGAYHFFRPVPPGEWQYQDPALYIHNCVSTFLQLLGGNLGAQPPMLDLEVADNLAGNLVLARAKAWLEECMARTGVTPAIYTGPSFWKEIGGESADWAKDYPLALASYPFENDADYEVKAQAVLNGTRAVPEPVPPQPWTAATWIQWTGRAPKSLLPGYPTVGNWANTFDAYLLVEPPGPASQTGTTSQPGTSQTGPTSQPAGPAQPGSAATYQVTGAAQLNVRAGPPDATGNLNPTIVKILNQGDIVQVVETTNGWAHLSAPVDGWCNAKYLVLGSE